MTTKQKRTPYTSLKKLISDCMRSVIFKAKDIKGYAYLEESDSRLAVCFGDNATGKSLMSTALRSYIGPREEVGAEKITVSMHMRTNGGMAQVFMYQDEAYSSTGASSLKAVRGAFHNAKNRAWPVWIFLDEPDTGLSDRYASALGSYLAKEINGLPEHILGVTLITHSRPLLKRMLKELDMPPHQISMGQERTLMGYVYPAEEQEASIEELFEFADKAATTMKDVTQAIYNKTN